MEKVFVLVAKFTYDYDEEIIAKVYSTMEKARKAMEDIIKEEKEDSWLNKYVNEDGEFDEDIVVDKGKNSIDIYVDGSASQWDTHLCIMEKEVL